MPDNPPEKREPTPEEKTLVMGDEATVRALLATAGFTPRDDELRNFTEVYAVIKQMVAALYSVEEARYESPGLHFTPTPRFVDWA